MNKKSTYQLFKRWLHGDVKLEEQRQLLKEAKDDPFIEEAIEGYSAFPEGNHLERISAINAKVSAKHQKRRVAASWRSMAAAITLLLMLGAGFWWINQSGADQIVEQTETKEVNREALAEVDDIVIPSPEEKEMPTAKIESSQDQHQSTAKQQQRQRKEEATFKKEKKPAKALVRSDTSNSVAPIAFLDEPISSYDAEGVESKIALEPANDLSARAADTALSTLDDFNQKKDEYAAKDIDKIVVGQVVDGESGEPLIGASILEKGTMNGTVSDLDGYFSLTMLDTTAMLIISYTGYSGNELFVDKGDSIVSTLYAGQALDEVVVTSGESRKSRPKESTSYIQRSKPVEGLNKYRRYIKRNLQYPEPADQAGIEGEVVLSFKVDNQGHPDDIRIERSLGYGCDEEAIRLLKEGPLWEPTSNRIRYTIEFK